MSAHDGGSAFASITDVSKVVDPSSYNLGDGPEHLIYKKIIHTTGGLSVRDYFAARALQGYWASPPETLPKGKTVSGRRSEMCALFYDWADAMLDERAKVQK